MWGVKKLVIKKENRHDTHQQLEVTNQTPYRNRLQHQQLISKLPIKSGEFIMEYCKQG